MQTNCIIIIMDCDTYYALYDYLDIDTIENIAMSSKMLFDCMPIKYKDIIKFKYIVTRINNNYKELVELREEDENNMYGYQCDIVRTRIAKEMTELECIIYHCVCDYDFCIRESLEHFDCCVTLKNLGINTLHNPDEYGLVQIEI